MSRNGGRRYRQDLLGKLYKEWPKDGRVKITFLVVTFVASINIEDAFSLNRLDARSSVSTALSVLILASLLQDRAVNQICVVYLSPVVTRIAHRDIVF